MKWPSSPKQEKPELVEWAMAQTYRHYHPDATEFAVNFGAYLPKRFSPCGRYLLSFAANMTSLMIHRIRPEEATPREFFEEKHTLTVGTPERQLIKEFCLFLPDKELFLVAVAQRANPGEGNQTISYTLQELPFVLQDFFLLLFSLKTGKKVDVLKISNEHINFLGRCGVSLVGSLLSVLLSKAQAIMIYKVTKRGILRVFQVGLGLVPELVPETGHQVPILLGFKQRFLAFLYRKLQRSSFRHEALLYFHAQSETLAKLLVWKALLLDKEHLWLMLVHPSVIFGAAEEKHQTTLFFVKYSFLNNKIKSISSSSDTLFLDNLFGVSTKPFQSVKENMPFGTTPLSWENALNTPRTCYFERKKFVSRLGLLANYVEDQLSLAKRKMAFFHPFNQRGEVQSPYCNQQLFLFSQDVLPHLKAQRAETTHRFVDRATGRLLFSLPLTEDHQLEEHETCYDSYLFHPFLPLVVTIFYSPSRSFVISVHYKKPSRVFKIY